MGYRTIVILYNDEQHVWEHDPELGKKIANSQRGNEEFDLGKVVEVAHADDQTIAVIDSYNYHQLAKSNWKFDEKHDEIKLKMLKLAAEEMGYSLVKK